MTNKQILIDGVDVKECAYFRYPLGCNSLDNKTCQCMNNDCYYKEHKRTEQEVEKLRGVIRKDICSHYVLGECSKNHHNNCVGRNQCIKDLEQECEELKIYIESNEQQVKEVETLVMDNDRLINELNQLKQVLSDIKNIVDTCNSGINCSECPYAEECRTDTEAEALGVCKLILQKFEGLNDI